MESLLRSSFSFSSRLLFIFISLTPVVFVINNSDSSTEATPMNSTIKLPQSPTPMPISRTRFIETPKNQTAFVGETVKMICIVENNLGPLQWTFNGFGLGTLTDYQNYALLGNQSRGDYSLAIKNVSMEDAGSYECQAMPGANGLGALRSPKAFITVVDSYSPVDFNSKSKSSTFDIKFDLELKDPQEVVVDILIISFLVCVGVCGILLILLAVVNVICWIRRPSSSLFPPRPATIPVSNATTVAAARERERSTCTVLVDLAADNYQVDVNEQDPNRSTNATQETIVSSRGLESEQDLDVPDSAQSNRSLISSFPELDHDLAKSFHSLVEANETDDTGNDNEPSESDYRDMLKFYALAKYSDCDF